MDGRPTGVLVSSVSRKVPLLRAVRDALAAVGPPGARLHGGDADPGAIGAHFVDAFWLMPPLAELDVEDVVAHCEAEGIVLVIPTRDGELAYWAAHRPRLARAGVSVLGAGPAAVAVCLDKLAFARRLREAGEPAIPTALRLEELGGAPYAVKERFGAGGASVGLGLSGPEAVAHARELRQPVFQPFVAGAEFSLDVFVSADRRLRGVVARRRETVVGGEAHVTVTVRDARLEALGGRVADHLGLVGPAVVQVLVDADGAHHVVECNARVGGASTLAVAVGLDVFAWAYLEARGEALDGHPFRRRAGELRQVRAMHDVRFAVAS